MDILNASNTHGLARALETVLAGARGPVTLFDAVDIRARLRDARPLDVLVLDDAITVYPDETLENTLWDLIHLAAERTVPVRTLLILHADRLPVTIRQPLQQVAQQFGGAAYELPTLATARHTGQAATWVVQQLQLTDQVPQQWMLPLSSAGGVGKSSQLANIAIGFAQQGFRVLMIDADFANGSLSGFFKVPPGTVEPFLTLREEFPITPIGGYPREAVVRRIAQHPAGLDLLLSGRGLVEIDDMSRDAMRTFLTTVRTLPYDIVAIDAGPDLKARPYATDLLSAGALALVIAQPGRKERRGAENVLDLLSHMTAPGKNRSMLSQTALMMVEPEVGSVASPLAVQRDLLRQYRDIIDLGIVPRDARLLSTIAERVEWTSVYAADPKGRYCRALTHAVTTLMTQLSLTPRTSAPATAAARRGLGRLFAPRERAVGESV